MSRVRASDGPGISLFPFLAVLLCTMGALLVLLVIFSRSAAGHREAEEVAILEEMAVEREGLRWRVEQLQAMRQKTLDDLSQARLGLAGIEDNARALSDELAALEREIAALEAAKTAGTSNLEKELSTLEQRLAEVTQALQEARESAADRPPAYAIVPYDGQNGTHRRPLYIECSLDGVFLQPEGIRLRPSDFEGPAGPGNPLASALRAAREHLAERGRSSASPAEQPYPLLLVRPSGVMAYYAAREAIASWGSDFGYQLVEEHWQLKFPAPDLQLADVERRAIDEARTRLAWLEQVQGARVARQASPRVQYRAAQTRGGVVVDGGPSVLGDQSRFEWREPGGDGDGSGSGQGPGVFGSPEAAGVAARAGLAGDGPMNAAGGPADGVGGGDAVLGRGTGSYGAGYGPDGGVGADQSRYVGPSAFASAAGAPGDGAWPGGQPAGQPGQSYFGGEGGTGGTGTGRGGEGDGGDGGDAGGDSSQGTPPVSSFAGSAGAAGGSNGSSSAGSPQGAGGMSSSAAGQQGGGGVGVNMQTGGGGDVASLASSRGANWASMATRDRPVPLSRPVQIECDRDELRVFDSGRRRVVKTVPLGARTADSIDPLIEAVRQHVDSWGLAGDRMYWNPRLVLSATPGGAGRREDIEALLAGSGLATVRRDEQAVAALPAAAPVGEPSVAR
ncbi:MAG: hypothetical protein ACO3NZ_10695 [Pirellulales bacterium]